MYLESSEPWVRPVHLIFEGNNTIEDLHSQDKEWKMGRWTMIMDVLHNLPLAPWIIKVIWGLHVENSLACQCQKAQTGEVRSAVRKGLSESGVLTTACSISLRSVCICSQKGCWSVTSALCYQGDSGLTERVRKCAFLFYFWKQVWRLVLIFL